ncbi:MAG: glycosyltransferase family 9 protein [Planctomycetota bacterium]
MAAPIAPRRVLLVRLSHLGDIAQTLPLLHAVQAAWPGAEVAWAVQPEFSGLIGPLARVLPFERRGGAGAWRALRAEVRSFDPDLVLDAQGNWKSAVAARLAGRRARAIGFARSEWQEPLASRVTRPDHAPPAQGPHLVDRCLALARHAVGGPVEARLDPALDERERLRGAELLGDVGEAPILLHPGVPGDRRSWPKDRFAELARVLGERGRSVVVLTGPGEASVGRQLEADVRNARRHIVGQRGLRDLGGLLAAAHARGGRLVVGDSGPAHVAASVGLPVVLLAGPEDPSRTGPWPIAGTNGSPHRVAGPAWIPRAIESITVGDVVESLAPA